MRLLLWLLANALALLVAIWLLDGITLQADGRAEQVMQLLVAGGILGVVDALVKPVLKFISFPVIVLTLGLALVVINALMLMLTSRIAESLDLGFHVDGFWSAVLGGIVVSLAAMIIGAVLPEDD